MSCILCNLEKETKWYHKSSQFVICDCKTCKIPMVVLKEHTMEIEFSLLVAILAEIEDQFGGDYKLRTNQRVIPDHLHWHILL